MDDQEEHLDEDDEDASLSTRAKVAAGAAIGLAVPAAVGVVRKLRASEDDESVDDSEEEETRARAAPTRSSGGTSSRSRGSSSTRSKQQASTREDLYSEAQRLKIEGRSRMTKAQLERAVARAGRRK